MRDDLETVQTGSQIVCNKTLTVRDTACHQGVDGGTTSMDSKKGSMEDWTISVENKMRSIDNWTTSMESKKGSMEKWTISVENKKGSMEHWIT